MTVVGKIKLDICNIPFFLAETMKLESDVLIYSDKYVVDGKSLMGIYSLNLSKILELKMVEKVDGEIEQLVNKLKDLKIMIE